jgi:thiol-disulfide isomerase/thioredoxin
MKLDLARLAPLFLLALAACRADNTEPYKGEGTATAAAAIAPRPAPAAAAGEGWNAAQIAWESSYEAGVARAKAENKPVCLVLYTTWCPHCRNYSHVFDDPRVVERAHDFVMIRLDADKESDVAQRFSKDGSYIPRTFFVGSDGAADFSIHAARDKFAYFYDERDAGSILGGMADALKKLKR